MEIYHLSPAAPLTDAEKASPYACLYELPIPEPDPAHLKHFLPDAPMDPANAIPITELEKLFTPGALKQDNGYCLLPDGTGYTVAHAEMPDVTPEMEEFWSKGWIGQDDVHYKCWFPGMHISHKMPVVENLGWGVGRISFACPLILPKLLSAPPQALDPSFVGFTGCSGFFTLVDDPSDVWYNTVANCVRRREAGGLEIYTVNWAGIHLIEGKPVRKIGENETADLERCRLYGCHHAWENARKNQILPLAYEISKTALIG